jgi:diacylglycerol kinase family enzyme
MKALLIHHQGAGTDGPSCQALTETLEQAGWKVRYLKRKEADGKAIRAAKADLIVIAGGDGTVAKVLAMLPDRSVPAAIIPTGTANDIARSLGIEGDPEAIVQGWDIDRRRRFDIGNVHGPWGCRPFAEGVGFGAFADSLRLVRDADGEEKMQAGREAMRKAMRESAPLPLDIALDGEPLQDGLLLVEVMNVPLAGPRLPIAPDADAGDGRLHVAFVREQDREAMREWLRGEPKEGAPVEQGSGREVIVRGGGATMRIDDQCRWLEPESKVRIRLEGEPAQLLAPPDAPALAG